MKLLKSAIIAIALFSTSAMASLIGVDSITITSSDKNTASQDYFLQISELLAIDGSGNDVALASAGATVVGSDNYLFPSATGTTNHGIDLTIDGVIAMNSNIGFYQSNNGIADAFVTVTLGAVTDLTSFSVVGRTDACCNSRDVYNVNFFNAAGGLIHTALNLNANNPSSTGTVTFATIAPPPVAVSAPSMIALLLAGVAMVGLRKKSLN